LKRRRGRRREKKFQKIFDERFVCARAEATQRVVEKRRTDSPPTDSRRAAAKCFS
jgi:hypothetical protein